MKGLLRDTLTVLLPQRRRLWKDREKAFELHKRLLGEYQSLAELPKTSCDLSNLRHWDASAFNEFLADPNREKEWSALKEKLELTTTPGMPGGVNRGDQRLIFHLVQYLQPRKVLEIGTHIGASTLHISSALQNTGKQGTLTTVDIKDVNDPNFKPWLLDGVRHSPEEMLKIAGAEQLVTFHVSDSVEFLKKSTESFDLIFLDGDHSSTAVYREIPLALERLSEGGIILLHDFFPSLEPLWPEEQIQDSMIHQSVISGPFLACQRFEREKAGFCVLPFGALPWTTKLGTNVTSLALVDHNR